MRRALATIAALAALAVPASSGAAWQTAHSGSAFASARALASPAAPSVSVTGRNVTVSWSPPATGPAPAAYVVRRFDSATSAEQTMSSGCSGSQSTLSCTEPAAPAGTWKYTVAAVRGNWQGAQSAKSAAVTVDPPDLVLTPTTVTSLPATLSGGIDGFSTGQTIVARLDDPVSGTLLGGSMTPATIPADGAATGSLILPASVTNGSHTIYAIGSGGDVAALPITVLTPTVASARIVKTAGGDGDFVKRSGTYYVYANVTGSGSPPAGLASVSANVSAVTPAATATPLTAGSYTAGGATYNYRSAQLTASSTLTNGAKSFTVTATDQGGTGKSGTFGATADSVVPTAADVQAANAGIARRVERNDSLVLTYSEPMEPVSILSGWSGDSTSVVVRLVNGTNDSIQIWNAANGAQLPLGSVSLGRSDYTTSTITFGATGTPSTMVRSGSAITILLGTASATAPTAAGTGTMTWTPSATATDRAGNAASTTARTETGTADSDF